MEKLKELIKKCACSVTLEVNNHKNYYQTVEEYVSDLRNF